MLLLCFSPAVRIPRTSTPPRSPSGERPGTNFADLGINFQDLLHAKREVREALAFATDREALVKFLLHGEAPVANGILPPNHWAYEPNVTQYPADTARAETASAFTSR